MLYRNIQAYRNLLFQYLKPQSGAVAALAALLLTGTGLQLVSPQILRYFIDTARSSAPLQSLYGAALLYIFLPLAKHVLQLAAGFKASQVGWRATNLLRKELAQLFVSYLWFTTDLPRDFGALIGDYKIQEVSIEPIMIIQAKRT